MKARPLFYVIKERCFPDCNKKINKIKGRTLIS